MARFDSDVVNGDSGVIPSIPCDQLSKDMSASETPLMSRAILSSKPDSMQNRGKGCSVNVIVNTFIHAHLPF